VLAILSSASAVIAEGEVMQLVTAKDTATSEDDYLRVITAKTARLFAAAAEVGGVVAVQPGEDNRALFDFGLNLGISFQLVDDGLDYAAAEEAIGKTVGDDFREGKITLPVVLAFERGDAEERAFWRRCVEQLEQRDEDLNQALGLMDKHRTLEDSLSRAREYGKTAMGALSDFPDTPLRRAMIDVVDFCIERAY
jgi:octaprenyl-diphosphate synthase